MITSGLQAATQSFDAPARQSWVPLMVPREYVGGAIGLNSVAFNAPSVVGPPLAGLADRRRSASRRAFSSTRSRRCAVLVALIFMQPAPPSSSRRGNVIGAIVEGVRFLIGHPVLRWVVLLLVVTSLTIRPYNFLLPAYAVHVVHTDANGLGWLMAATGVGAICGAFFTAATGGERRGTIWLVSGARRRRWAWPRSALTSHYGVAAAILSVIGLATLSFIGSSNILLQTLAPDDMRGRAISVYGDDPAGLRPVRLAARRLARDAASTLRWTFVLGGSDLARCARSRSRSRSRRCATHDRRRFSSLMLAAIVALALIAKRLHVPYPVVFVVGGLVLALIPARADDRAPAGSRVPAVPPAADLRRRLDDRLPLVHALARPIFMLAIGLVAFTSAVVAYVAHWMIGLPLAVGFVLGGVLSPTDAVAADAIAEDVGLPHSA